jgi:putative membrane protein
MLLDTRIPPSYILRKIRYNLISVSVVSVTVHVVSTEYQNFLPVMPPTIPGFIGTAISILLSFKIGQSYDRWWEARKVWGAIVNDSRTLVIQLKSFVAGGNEATVRKMGLRQIAWCFSLGQSLRKQPPTENLRRLLSEQDLEEISRQTNKPLAMIDLHAADLRELRTRDQLELFAQVQMDSTLVRLVEAQGQAERIKSTVFPVTYRIFLHGIIYLFVVTLSLSLKDVPFRFELPLLLAISMPFFLLEKSATHMQDPF